MGIEWEVRLPGDIKVPREAVKAAGGDELIAGVLYRRGFKNPESIRQFLYGEFYTPIDPFTIPGMDKAMLLIEQAVREQYTVAVYGDYDVDGVTSTVLLMEGLSHYLDSMLYHVPNRFTEGYGMNVDVIRQLSSKGVDLIITCDCGIGNHQEIELARELGMKVLVTDHHNLPQELPCADVIINPKQLELCHPAFFLPGVGVAYMVMKAWYQVKDREFPCNKYLDLAALGVIADVVPVEGENRYLLRKGLPYLLHPIRPGLKAMKSVMTDTVKLTTEEDIAFQLAPRLNAAGRMKSAELPVELLLCQDEQRAYELAQELDHLNTMRKQIQDNMIREGIEMVEDTQKTKGVLVLYRPYWHQGILGIAAGRLAEEYKRPVICLSLKDDGKTLVGSARSVGGISIYDLLLECSEYLLGFGGHAQAAGLSLRLDNLDLFTRRLQNLLPSAAIGLESSLEPDVEIALSAVDEDLYYRIRKMAPFGEGFPAPVFLSPQVKVISDRSIGSRKHRRLLIWDGQAKREAVWWWAGEKSREGSVLDIVYTLSMNHFRSIPSLNLVIADGISTEDRVESYLMPHKVRWKVMDSQSIDVISRQFPGAVFYYEGMKKLGLDTVTRYDVIDAETLVLMSIPPTPDILRELVLGSGAQKVLLAADFKEQSLNTFLKTLMGFLKHGIMKNSGYIPFRQLCSLLSAGEGLVELALEYLQTEGRILYWWEDEWTFLVQPCSPGTAKKSGKRIKMRLGNAYKEMIAFKRYMITQDELVINNILREY